MLNSIFWWTKMHYFLSTNLSTIVQYLFSDMLIITQIDTFSKYIMAI